MSDTLTPERIARMRDEIKSAFVKRDRDVVLDTLEMLALLDAAEERDTLRNEWAKENNEICQSLGKALGYPWFKDDPKNFPDATDADGVCVGEHVAVTIAAEAASCVATLRAEVDQAKRMNAELRKDVRARDSHIEGLEAKNARLKAKLDFLEEKGITVGPMQSSDRAEPYLAYVIRPDSELDDTDTISKLTDAQIENARLRALARVQVEDRWRPIETAPKDGTLIVGWDQRIMRGKGLPRLMLWGDNLSTDKKGWMPIEIVVEFQPTHWRPLPMTPAEEDELDALRKAVAMEGETP